MESIRFETDGRHEFIWLGDTKYRKVPTQDKFEDGTEYFNYKGKCYAKI